MGPAPTVQASASCRPRDEAKLNQVRLDDFLNGVTGFGQAGGQRFHPHRPATIDVGDHVQIAAAHRSKAQHIELQQIGRASWRERVGQYVYIWVDGAALKTNNKT